MTKMANLMARMTKFRIEVKWDGFLGVLQRRAFDLKMHWGTWMRRRR